MIFVWSEGAAINNRCVAVIITLTEQRGKWLANIQIEILFFLLMRENFMPLNYSSSFFFSHVKEHGSMRASLTHSRTGQEGAGRQARVFPKLHSPVMLTPLKKKKKKILGFRIFRGGFHCPLWSCFLLLGFSFDSKVLFYVLWHKKITPLIFRDFINLQKKTESTIKIIDL